MEIKLNNQIKLIDSGTTLSEIVTEQLGMQQKGIAVAVNNTVIQKEFWRSTQLKQNDDLIIIKATQGG